MTYTTKRLTADTTQVSYKYKKGFEAWVLLSSDHHWDNPKCKLQLLKKHHSQALEKNAAIFCFGDLFCAMQGKGDRRHAKSDVRPEHQKNNYLDSLVNTAQEWYTPFAKNYVLISEGNHETSVFKHHETDILQRLVSKINGSEKTEIIKGKYTGWIIFRFEHKGGGKVRTIKIKYNHGYGGGGPVTKGVIQTNRRAVYLPDADIIVTGHVHERWEVDTMQERLKNNGETYLKHQRHLQLPTYKEEYLPAAGYHIESGRPPKPLGGCWLRFYLDGEKINYQTFWAD